MDTTSRTKALPRANARCGWKTEDGKVRCAHKREPRQTYCVAHLAERTPEQERRFNSLISEILCQEVGSYNFRGFVFPEGFSQFRKREFEKDVDLRWSVFQGDADLEHARLRANLYLRGAKIGGNAKLRYAKISGDVSFREACVEANVSLRRAEIGGNVSFARAKIRGNLIVVWVKIEGSVILDHVTIVGNADFQGTAIPASGKFKGVKIRAGQGESLCRFAKRVCENMGEYRKAGDWHFKERCHAWSHKVSQKSNRRTKVKMWLELVFGRWLFRYGQMPLHVILGAIITTIAVCAAGFLVTGGVVKDDPSGSVLSSPWDALYFSFVTFTTLGFGDYRPLEPAARALASVEAFSGVLMMALLAVSLAKRYSRA